MCVTLHFKLSFTFFSSGLHHRYLGKNLFAHCCTFLGLLMIYLSMGQFQILIVQLTYCDGLGCLSFL
jgi:hypothetical protein